MVGLGRIDPDLVGLTTFVTRPSEINANGLPLAGSETRATAGLEDCATVEMSKCVTSSVFKNIFFLV